MAVTGNKKQVYYGAQGQNPGAAYQNPAQQGQPARPAQQAPAYTGLAGVSQNTAQNMGNMQQGYKPSDTVAQAQQTLQQIQGQKPGAFQSRFGDMMDGILQQINNPQEFKYEFNSDNIFKNYADLYNQYAKQGMIDTMGQAAGLTGGYGNSYAMAAGQQQYQQNMLPLYEKGMDLRDRAYQQYRDRIGDQYNQYNLLANADQTDYGRYRDTLGDWQTEEEQAYNRYMNAQNMDYTMFQNDRDYWTGLAQVENAAYETEQQRQEAIRQYNQDYQLRMAQFEEDKRRYNQEWDHQMALEAAAAAGGPGGYGGRGGDGGDGESPGKVFPINGKYYYFDKNGKMTQISEEEAKKANSLDYTLQDAQDMYNGVVNDAKGLAEGVINKGMDALTNWFTSGSNPRKKDARLERVR